MNVRRLGRVVWLLAPAMVFSLLCGSLPHRYAFARTGKHFAATDGKIEILFKGINIAHSATPVVVDAGQPITLMAVRSDGTGLQNPHWTIPGAAATGGWEVLPSTQNPQQGHELPLDQNSINTNTVRFFWKVTGSTQTIEFGSKSGDASATFSVEGPFDTKVSTKFGPLFIWSSKDNRTCPAECLEFGDSRNPGIVFTATSSRMQSGTYQWVQIMEKYRWSAVASTVTYLCSAFSDSVPRFDTNSQSKQYPLLYPYPFTNDPPDSAPYHRTAQDSLDLSFGRPYQELGLDFAADMHLLWTSDRPGSIPVPLRKVNWSVSIHATLIVNAWKLTRSVFQSSAGSSSASDRVYPTWSEDIVSPLHQEFCRSYPNL